MERLTKIAFYVGIGIAVSVFALFLISFLPLVIGNAGNAWERLGDTGRSDGETLAKFQEHPAYVAMYERFPGAVEKVEYHEGGGSMEVGAMNFENNSQLVLSTGQSNPLTPTKNTPKRRLASQSGIADGFGLSKKGSILRKICIVPLYGWVFLTRIRSGYQVALEPVVHLAL